MSREEHHASIFGGGQHHSTWSHEMLGGAAAFEAFRLWEQQHPGDQHQLSKEILAGLAGAEVDKLFETHGLDFLDKEQAKLHATQHADDLVVGLAVH
ncbi:unnamed protein product [Adineta steineri]|uniref:Uncharacterized protein n=1 Tax=Adineta steineri TaxID=433720 RepID=A0A815KRI2_9BILA|nr:unnamed protein product [Adineta steineri]CAF0916284.1 unnamed protein product [Adineta steineri]CAF0996835.1 unnamed protein product [Adineta steineri]CAF1352780.1 unnamed protein product [Adineta steineri]CAF1397193.1 unnamed protein product [Adineta steineri]